MQSNIGLEAKFFNGIVEINADLYQEVRHNILDYRYTMPSTTGLEKPQLGNVGKARSRGIDLSGKVQHMFSPDFWMILNGTFTYSKATYREIEEATSKPVMATAGGTRTVAADRLHCGRTFPGPSGN